MARVNIARVDLAVAGTPIGAAGSETTADEANGHKFLVDRNTFVIVRNTSVTPYGIELLRDEKTIDGGGVANKIPAQLAQDELFIYGPFPKGWYEQKTAEPGYAYVDVESGSGTALRFMCVR